MNTHKTGAFFALYALLAAAVLALAGCPAKPAAAAADADAELRDTAMAIVWQQQSGEYAALCYQAFNAGRAAVQAAAAGGQYAAVLDIDETVLDNSPYAAYLVHENTPWSAESWEAWCTAAAAEAVPGALDFCRFLAENGIEIFYISNRPISVLSATTENLRALGFPGVRADRVLLQTGTSDKTPRVDSVREQGYTVVLCAGDNLDDFDGSIRKDTNAVRKQWAAENAARFGVYYLVLPNAAYGTFEGALAGGYYGKSPGERAAVRIGLLKSWK
ncbi:MAG: 5'-nucleotidase, lipoprotein e(P4) family [Spirochaetaceae bacterium]|jgi:5'-nucleotidase (lipoprotein e(P4) family)|nr:5'-nucleotidase, lipoprotein e(P4) family [Spirochaetaceae bacterium]